MHLADRLVAVKLFLKFLLKCSGITIVLVSGVHQSDSVIYIYIYIYIHIYNSIYKISDQEGPTV